MVGNLDVLIKEDYNILTPRTHTGDELLLPVTMPGFVYEGGYSDGTTTDYFEIYRNGVKMSFNNTIPGFGNYDYGDLASYNSKNPNGIRIVYDLGWKMKHYQWGENMILLITGGISSRESLKLLRRY